MKREPPERGSQRLGGQARTPRAYTEPLTIPNHRLHPDEWSLRFLMNTLDRDRPSFWLRELRWRHRERDECACNGCRLDGAA
jgi:hypothetical protein